MPLGSFQNGLGNVPDQIRIGPCGRRGPVSRISIAYPLLGHDSAEQVNYGIMVGHEAPLVLQLVEEDILAVDPDVRVSDLPVDRYLSLNLVFGIIFRYPEIGLAELAVAAAAPHHLDKPVSRRALNIWNLLQLRPARNVNELWAVVRLDVVVNSSNNMITLADDHMVHSQRLGVPVADLHLPAARPTQDQLRLRILLPGPIDLSNKLQELPLRIGRKLSAIGEHHAHRSQPHRIHGPDGQQPPRPHHTFLEGTTLVSADHKAPSRPLRQSVGLMELESRRRIGELSRPERN